MKKRYIMAGKRERFDWEDEGRIVFTRDPKVEIAGLAKDGYVEFYVLEQTMKMTHGSTETELTQKEEELQDVIDYTTNELQRLLSENGGKNVGRIFDLYETLRELKRK
jgi:hypothetical protein